MTTPTLKQLCTNCKGTGWVCEDHTNIPWNGGNGCCGGAGQPCHECNPSDRDNAPRDPEGFKVIMDKEGSRH